ncbi:hypothetical protein SAMN05518849_101961 [Sphingobium sp. AP50]|uniref:SMI1/KNR4 family protein n=1 Tax=Sphingobium sp. AP50 TaxID=1884369 RepID=UPI0008D7AE35|nr:SMI1/KNR4 family protein [Sphingobium sp. AP50]SEI80064.1 hypothetical protein SAMN05518849_101961 [Sphingobium sp. AP50]
MNEPTFAHRLLQYDDATSLALTNGARFIRKLPDDRSLGYLHKLFPAVTDRQLDELEEALVRPIPVAYRAFLLWSDGACFFDNSIYLYGFAENQARSLEPVDQTAISIRQENQLFSVAESERWSAGWMKVGNTVAWSSKVDLLLHEDGACAIIGVTGSHVAGSFDEAIHLLLDRIGPCFSGDGLIDRDYANLEAGLASLVRPAN